MLKIVYHNQFKRDYKRIIKRGCNPSLLTNVLSIIVNEQPLPAKYKDHSLAASSYYKGVRECHVQPDWLLIYRINQETQILYLIRTGTYSDLFK